MVLGFLLLLFIVGCSANTDEEVTTLVSNYLKALETNDISSIVKYADDVRFSDKAEQKEQYSTINSDITDTKIVKLKKVNETEFEVTIEVVEKGNLTKLTFPVKKQKTGWKVIVGQDYSS